jgi:uncharacterized protein (TIGR02452 family)
VNQDVVSYWHDRAAFAEAAREHHKKMLKTYADQIAESVKGTVVYGGDGKEPEKDGMRETEPSFLFTEQNTVPALYKAAELYPGKKIAVLNFASYQHPGSKYMDGDLGQEESLCRESTLYECLMGCPAFYEWNRQHKNHALYTDRALYVPNVIFGWNGAVTSDVISIAPPNRTAYARYFGETADKYNHNALASRIRFIKEVAESEHVQVLIIGAFGCGEAGQDQDEVASLFHDAFAVTSVEHVVCAVPPKNAKNQEAFQRVFGKLSA